MQRKSPLLAVRRVVHMAHDGLAIDEAEQPLVVARVVSLLGDVELVGEEQVRTVDD